VLGVDFGGSKIAAAVADLDGSFVVERTVETDPALGAMANLDRALALARALLAEASPQVDGSSAVRLVAVGSCTFGIPREHGVELSPAIPGWDKLPLARQLEDAFAVPVRLVTDVKAAAAAEARAGALVGADPGIYLNLGTGLAAAIVQRGEVVTGAHGASGEVGYCLRTPEDVEIVGPPAGSTADGARPGRSPAAGEGASTPAGPFLEDFVSGMGLSAALAEVDGAGAAPARHLGASDVFDRAAKEPALQHIVRQFLIELAYHLVNITIAVDPDRIAVGGGMVGSWDVIGPALHAALEAHVPYPPELVLGAFPYDAALRGAVETGLRLARSGDTSGAAAASPRAASR
jgi:glucokinase